jgi:hypothetical protein
MEEQPIGDGKRGEAERSGSEAWGFESHANVTPGGDGHPSVTFDEGWPAVRTVDV